MIKLDDVRLGQLDFIKINVEGSESDLLKGGEQTMLSFRPRMQIEIHTGHFPDCLVCGWLLDRGFATRLLHERQGSHWIQAG